MSMNAYHCCIVFSNNRDKAVQKFEDIFIEKGSPDNIKRIMAKDRIEYIFEDEDWIWIRPALGARGYRAHKAYVDIDCTKEQIDCAIRPICDLYCDEKDFKWF